MKKRTLNELRQTREYGYTPPSPSRIKSTYPQPAPLKNGVLNKLEGLKDKVFNGVKHLINNIIDEDNRD